MVQLAETPVAMPLMCMDVTCGKGTPATSAPAPAVALAAVMAGIAVAAVAASVIRRRRALVAPCLPGPATRSSTRLSSPSSNHHPVRPVPR